MRAKTFVKVVLKFWDWGIFGTTASFYEMHTARPLLDQLSVTVSFKNEFFLFQYIIWFCCNFSSFGCTFEKLILKQLPIIFKCVSKTCKGTAKTKHSVVIIKQSVIPSKFWVIFDQSIASTKTKYIKLNTKTQIFINNIRLLYTL